MLLLVMVLVVKPEAFFFGLAGWPMATAPLYPMLLLIVIPGLLFCLYKLISKIRDRRRRFWTWPAKLTMLLLLCLLTLEFGGWGYTWGLRIFIKRNINPDTVLAWADQYTPKPPNLPDSKGCVWVPWQDRPNMGNSGVVGVVYLNTKDHSVEIWLGGRWGGSKIIITRGNGAGEQVAPNVWLDDFLGGG
jgi:hypothetical protein